MHKKQAKAEAKTWKKETGFVLTDDGLVHAGVKPVKDNLAQRSSAPEEKKEKVRVLQLIVAIIAGSAIIAGVIWQVFFKAS